MHTVLKIYLSRGSRADFCPLGPDFCGRWAHSPPVQLFCDTLGFSSDAFSPSNWLPGSQQHSQRLLQSSSEGRKLGLGWWKFPQSYHPVPYTTISWVSEPICIRQDFNKRHQSFVWAWNQVVPCTQLTIMFKISHYFYIYWLHNIPLYWSPIGANRSFLFHGVKIVSIEL